MFPDAIRQTLPYRALRRLKRALTTASGAAVPSSQPTPAPDDGIGGVRGPHAPGFQWADDADWQGSARPGAPCRVWVETPEPPHNLVNALYNESYWTLIDHCARGVGRHMTEPGLTNNVIENERVLYVRDDATGRFFAASWTPVARPPDAYRATSEPGSQLFENTTNGLEVVWRIFVPAGEDPVEIWNVSVRDLTGQPRRVSLFSHVSMPCDGVDLYSGGMFRVARYLPGTRAIYVQTDAEQHATMDFPWHNGFMTADREPAGWDANPGAFLGGGGRTLREPRAVAEGRSGNSMQAMWPPIASLRLRLDVPAGGQAGTRLLVGACAGPEMIDRLRAKYLVPWLDRDEHLEAVRAAVGELAGASRIDAPEPSIGGMLNVWVKLQSHFGLRWGRWGFCGYRDQLQHAIGCLGLGGGAVAMARDRILAACRHQMADGFALRGWRPIDRHRNVDSASWLVPAVSEYVKETGDWSLLAERAPFFESGDKKSDSEKAGGETGTVLNHLERAMDRLWADRGARGLPLSLEGDWNDSLTGPCRAGRGESVWMGMAFCRAAGQLAELADWWAAHFGALAAKAPALAAAASQDDLRELSARLSARRAAMAESINAHGWDGGAAASDSANNSNDKSDGNSVNNSGGGRWYLCALDDDGAPVGSAANDEGRIFLNPQSWAVLAGVADDARWESAWAAAREHLDAGGWGYMLNWPHYSRPVANVGRLSYIRPGAGENASVYTHGNAFLMLALLERGLADEALAVWRAIWPGNPDRPGAAMPHVFYNGFYGPASEIAPGLADHPWTTGSAAWMAWGAMEKMLGLRRTFDGLVVRPCLPSSWPTARVERLYRGTLYRVMIDNPHAVSGAAVESILVDGRPHPAAAPLPIDAAEHEVLVRLGDRPATR
jgi:cellobiose phosphorylase